MFTSKMASSDSHHFTRATIFYGPVINPVSLSRFDTLPHCLLYINPSGKIEWMVDNVYEHHLQKTLALKGLSHFKIVYLKDGEFLMPGFIDTHTVTRCSLIVRDLVPDYFVV
jgi:guanine deaminase